MKTILVAMLLLSSSVTAFADQGFARANERLEQVSRRFVGTHYVLDPLGEGKDGRYDADPLYRFDAFDCTTFVETMMALAMARDGDQREFVGNLLRIRYKDGNIGYTTRNHFPEIDWIPNNTRAGFVRDVTEEIAGPFGIEWARAEIDKRAWYEHKTSDQINVPGLSEEERESRATELRAEGRKYSAELSEMPYISIDHEFFKNGRPNRTLFDRIPGGIVMNVIRPDWDETATEGTHLNVSHQALILRAGGELIIRHATTGEFHRVVDQPFVEYLRKLIGHATVKGVSFLKVEIPGL